MGAASLKPKPISKPKKRKNKLKIKNRLSNNAVEQETLASARPCPVVSQPGFSDDEDEVDGFVSAQPQSSSAAAKEVQPGLLPAPIRAEEEIGPEDLVIAPYSDFLHFKQVPEVPRTLVERNEIRSQSWPLPAPEEMSSGTQQVSIKASHVPAVFFAKRHRFTVFNYTDLLKNDKSCDDSGGGCAISVGREDNEIMRFTELSSKVDYCIRIKNSYQFSNEVDDEAFKDGKPRICAACSVKAKASLLPDLRHKYRFTFFHTIHVYSPSGIEAASKITLDEKSKIEPLSVMKICPTGRKTEKLKPEIVTLLQVTHFIRVETHAMPDSSPAMMPRPLPPEFREPRLIIIDEDLHGKAPPEPPEPEPQPEEEETEESFTKRPSRSEPPSEIGEEPPAAP